MWLWPMKGAEFQILGMTKQLTKALVIVTTEVRRGLYFLCTDIGKGITSISFYVVCSATGI